MGCARVRRGNLAGLAPRTGVPQVENSRPRDPTCYPLGVRWLPRLLIAASFATLSTAIALVSCNQTQGVEACRAIEGARCEVAPACPGFPAASSVDSCKRFYRDECLVGTENAEAGAADPAPCVAAIHALGACSGNDAATPCEGAPTLDASCIANDAAVDPTACNILMHCPEVLSACSFIAAPAAVTDAAADAVSNAVATEDAGDAADSSG